MTFLPEAAVAMVACPIAGCDRDDLPVTFLVAATLSSRLEGGSRLHTSVTVAPGGLAALRFHLRVRHAGHNVDRRSLHHVESSTQTDRPTGAPQ